MFKVTLKIKPNDTWVDGPVLLLSGPELSELSKTHTFFKVEDASEEDLRRHAGKVPSAFRGLFKEAA